MTLSLGTKGFFSCCFGTFAVFGIVSGGFFACSNKSFKGDTARTVPSQERPENNGREDSETSTNPSWGSHPCSKTSPKRDSVQVRISNNTNSRCDWGIGDNFQLQNSIMAARIERSISIPVPNGRSICSFSAQSESQTIRYDDHLILAINNNVLLASTTEVKSLRMANNGYREYAWQNIRGLSSGRKGSTFCADGVTCRLPQSEETGTFSFELSQDANRRLFSSLSNEPLTFLLVVTGDDDPEKDCKLYTDLTLTADYTYVD
jgi:hypothetical protein